MAARIAVVIPAYRTARSIVGVLSRLDASVTWCFVVDDRCPEGTGHLVRATVDDPRVSVLFNACNLGVGGATAVGFQAAFAAGADIIVKIDGDGQHRPEWIAAVAAPVARGHADMGKGNRFADFPACLRLMPTGRLIANVTLAAVCRPVTGYWSVSDPACGLFALHRKVVGHLPWERIDRRYFFESDLLFRLGMLRARVVQVPIAPIYAEEHGPAGARLEREALPFAWKSLRNLAERISGRSVDGGRALPARQGALLALASLALLGGAVGVGAFLFYGTARAPSPGTAAALLGGVAALAAFVRADIRGEPRNPIHPLLDDDPPFGAAGDGTRRNGDNADEGGSVSGA